MTNTEIIVMSTHIINPRLIHSAEIYITNTNIALIKITATYELSMRRKKISVTPLVCSFNKGDKNEK
jgi:hypothetical protein